MIHKSPAAESGALVWFRRDLRCNDHVALHHALVAYRHVRATSR